MAIDGIYDTGTISVNAGATAVTGVGTAWTTVGITPGDTFEAGGLIGLVESVTDNTHLTLTRAWPGASNLSGVGYQIVENSWLRSAISTSQRQIGRIVNILNGTGYIYPVAAGGTPDNSLGEDGQYAFDLTNNLLWKKVGGVWTGPTSIGSVINADVAAVVDVTAKSTYSGQTVYSELGLSLNDYLNVKTKLYGFGADCVTANPANRDFYVYDYVAQKFCMYIDPQLNVGFGGFGVSTFPQSVVDVKATAQSHPDSWANNLRLRDSAYPSIYITETTNSNGAIIGYQSTALNFAVNYSSSLYYRMRIDALKGVVLLPPSSVTPSNNGDLVFEATNNTTLKLKYKGSDGTVRSATLTLS